MTSGDAEGAERSVSMPVEQWCTLVQRGAAIPVTIPLMGTSMMPLIRYEKDPVTILPLRRPLERGDIVLFRREDGAFVVHRVYRLSEDGSRVQTWGDNCLTPDRPVACSEVLGLVVSMNRRGREIPLDTEKQRRRGIRWMDSPLRRKAWFAFRRIWVFAGNLARRLVPSLFHGRV